MTSKNDNFTYCFKKGVKFDPSHVGVGSEKEEVKDGRGVARKNCVTMSSTACIL